MMLQKAERTQFKTSTKRQAPAATAAGIVALVVVCVVNAHGQSPTAVKPRQPSYNIQRSTSDGSPRVGRKPKTRKESDSVFDKVRSTFGVWRALPKSSKGESKSVKGTWIRPTEKKRHRFLGRLRRRKPASSKSVADDFVGIAKLASFTDLKNARHTIALTNSSQRPAVQRAPPPDRLAPAAGIGARPIGPTGIMEPTEEQLFDRNDGLRIRRTVDSRRLSRAWETFDRDFSKHHPDHSNLNHRSHPDDNSSYFTSPQFGRESDILQVSRMQTENPVVDFLQSLISPQETPAPGGPKFKVPIAGAQNPGTVEITSHKGQISLIVRDAPIDHVLGLIAQQHGLNIVTSDAVTGQISVTLSDVPLDDALDAILRVNGYTWHRQKGILLITQIAGDSKVSPVLQGRQLRVFSLNYSSATDVDKVVQGLLSPIGQSFAIESEPLDKLRTREQIVVEDLPEYLERVEAYISQIDLPPRQVLIEAYILQVDLSDETRHGVDLQQLLLQIDNAGITMRTQGFTNEATSPSFFLGIDGTDLDALIEALTTTKDAKTLAAPKILVLNGQDARIQIGAQLGYLVTTTTQTSTLQQVQFLDVGVVLRVTPQITDDNHVLMTVFPEVSSGQINEITGLPEEETTEVQTTVMLADGQGMIIGGLIEETDIENQSKIPLLGDLWLVGRLFQRKSVTRKRSEIIIALIPRIVPYRSAYQHRENTELARATTRLLDGQLNRLDRRAFEPELPDAMRDPRKLKLRRIPHVFKNLFDPIPHPFEYYFPSVSEQSSWFPGFLYEGTVPFDAFAGQYESVPMLLDVTPGPDTDIGDEILTPTPAVPNIFPHNSPNYE